MAYIFSDRREAGQTLAATLLSQLGARSEPIVLALPRGGVPVALEVARAFKAPLDVLTTQRLEVPGHDGLSMGAVASGPVLVLQPSVIKRFEVSEETITRVVRKQSRQLERRERAYRSDAQATPLHDQTVLLIDDGSSELTAPVAAITAIRARRAKRLILALPVASRPSCAHLLRLVDDLVCLAMPTPFDGVASCYRDFSPVSDLDVRRMHSEAGWRVQRSRYLH